MTNAITFDTLQYAKKAKEVGFTEQQAEFQAEEIAKMVNEQNDQLVTRDYLAHEIKELEYKLLIKLGLMLVGVVTILAAIIKF